MSVRANPGKRINPVYTQTKDPKTGLTEIEHVMQYRDPPPPAPKVQKKQINFPLPWKQKAHGTNAASVAGMRSDLEIFRSNQRATSSLHAQSNTAPRDPTIGLATQNDVGPLQRAMAEEAHRIEAQRQWHAKNEALFGARDPRQASTIHFHKSDPTMMNLTQPPYKAPRGMGRAQVLQNIPAAFGRDLPSDSDAPQGLPYPSTAGTTFSNDGMIPFGSAITPHPMGTSLQGIGNNIPQTLQERRAGSAFMAQQQAPLPQGYDPILGVRRPYVNYDNTQLSNHHVNTLQKKASVAEAAERARVYEETTDIFGRPKQQYSPEHLTRIQREREDLERVSQEDKFRSEYDHFNKVMKRTVLVDNNAKTIAERNLQSKRFTDPNVKLDIFGNVIPPERLIQQQASLRKPHSGESKESLKVVGGSEPLVSYHQQQRNLTLGANPAGSSTYYNSQSTSIPAQPPAHAYHYSGSGAAAGQFPYFIQNPSAESYAPPNLLSNKMGDHDDGRGDVFRGTAANVERQKQDKMVERFFKSVLARKLIAAAGGWGVCHLRHILTEFDRDGDGILNRPEFKHAMIKFGVDLSVDELSTLMRLAVPAYSNENAGAAGAGGGDWLNLDSRFAPPNHTVRPPSISTIPDPMPHAVSSEKLLHVLRRGRAMPSDVEEVVRQCYQVIARKKNGVKTSSLQSSAQVTFADVSAATNLTMHSSYENCIAGSLRKVSVAFSNAWGPRVRNETPIDEERFVEFWADSRLSEPNDGDFIKMLRAMYGANRGRK